MALPRWLAGAILVVVTVVAWLPLVAVLLTVVTVMVTGCEVDEARDHPCIVAGHDIGPALGAGLLAVFLAGPALPFAIGAVLVWIKLRRISSRAAAAAPRGDAD